MAGPAGALRPASATSRRAPANGNGTGGPARRHDRRSGVRYGSDAAGARTSSADAPVMALVRQRSQSAGEGSARRERAGPRARSRVRSRSCARRTGRSGHDLGPARSGLRQLAGAAGHGGRGAKVTVVRGPDLRWPRRFHPGRTRATPPSSPPSTCISEATRALARLLDHWPPGLRSSACKGSATWSNWGRPTGCWARPIWRCRRRCCPAGLRAASETGEISHEAAAEWLVNRRSALAAKRSRIRVGHQDFFARPPGTR